MQPSGDACNPPGASQTFALALGTGKTSLVRIPTSGTTTTTATSTITAGFTIDLTFVNVAGRIRLEAGNDRSLVTNFSGIFDVIADPGGSTGARFR